MNDNTKWIIGAIVVLLIVLVGAYALSNGSNQPASNATATPAATVTPAPTTEATATATATPTTLPSATPTPTAAPTPSPTNTAGSGVKQTEFGYYITYPPFSYNDVHEGPHYAAPTPSPSVSPSPTPTPGGTVTFAYNYGSVYWGYETPESYSVELGDPVDGYLPVYILLHRTGDTSSAYWTNIEVSGSISDWGYKSVNPGFDAGNADMYYELDLPISYLSDRVSAEATLTLDDPNPYTATPYQTFWLYINELN